MKTGLWGDWIGAAKYLVQRNPKKYFLDISKFGRVELLELVENKHERVYKVLDYIEITYTYGEIL